MSLRPKGSVLPEACIAIITLNCRLSIGIASIRVSLHAKKFGNPNLNSHQVSSTEVIWSGYADGLSVRRILWRRVNVELRRLSCRGDLSANDKAYPKSVSPS